jgi:uncharacterized SAM-binding protein YcdF (DUF218 family)
VVRGRRVRRRLTRLVAVPAVVLLVWVLVCFRLLVHPHLDRVVPADAVVMLGGSSGARLDTAVALMSAGKAGQLVVSTPSDGSSTRSKQFCAQPHPYPVLCFDPSPSTTRGEAEEIRRLALARQWHTVIVVTSVFHISRARMTIHRCFKGNLLMVAPRHESISLATWAYQFGYQTAGWVQAQWLRSC